MTSLVAGLLVAFSATFHLPQLIALISLRKQFVFNGRFWEWLLPNQTAFCGIMPGMQEGRKPASGKNNKD